MAASSNLDQRAAVLLESLVRNHVLIDGNNHIGCRATAYGDAGAQLTRWY